ncbi:putative monovalent cation/H+ antiporter subunit A [Shinella pollutisoli]|uniref:Monovalent cation/H+ antiporter subunit A n=1 Tax=Shinella pollutisoli TaxID=2250594 RepID=A0ABV7DMV5_9HYPH|nr:putative monovalent cation/H+ antiporter subunit A [Shinella pollutisoli]
MALTFAALCLPFLAALAAPALTRLLGHRAAWPLALVPLAVFLHFLGFGAEIARGEVVTGGYAWVPAYNLSFSWFLDGLSLTFLLLISGIGALVVLYAGGYLRGHPQQGRFFAFLLLFMGAMLGLVAADSFLMLFVYWELTSIASFLLIGFDHGREAARRAALQALVVTGGGGLFLLAGLLILWNVTGLTQFSLLLSFGEEVRASPFYLAMLFLVLGGAFTKSAQFPFHVWLPNAMEAPTPVSAYLHSATMVKAGVYLLMRLSPVMGGTPAWETILPACGGLTLVVGAVLAIRETDLKRMLAQTTVASLGLLVLLTGFGSERAAAAAALYLVAHALFKGALFMLAGILDHETGTRDLTRLGGLAAAMPVTFAATLAAAASMAGLPPFLGFLGKEEVYAALAGGSPRAVVFTAAALAGNGLMVAVALALALKPFLGPRVETPRRPHEAPLLLSLGPALLALAGLAAGLFSGAFHAMLTSPLASAIAGRPETVTAAPVPHAGLPLALSAATLALGLIVYRLLGRARGAADRLVEDIGWGPDRGFDQAMRGLVRVSTAVTRAIQPGRLEVYMTATFAVLALALLVPPAVYGEWPALPLWPAGVPLHELAVMALAVAGVGAVLSARTRLAAILALGIQGFCVAVIFLLFGAPDLAFTQFMVETLSVVILALAMTRLRLEPRDHRPLREALPDAAIAVACGLGVALYLLRIVQGRFDTALTDFFNLYSRTVAHGANVVNVIIVDFRGTDTLGEITVVMVAGLAILSLIRIRKGRGT